MPPRRPRSHPETAVTPANRQTTPRAPPDPEAEATGSQTNAKSGLTQTRLKDQGLSGRGSAVGALLRPAAVPTFVADPGALRDRYLMLELPDLHAQVTAAMRTQPPAQRRQSAVQVFADWLAARVPPVPDDAHLANAMADLFDTRPDVLRLEEVAAGLAVSARTLQRLAKRYVGIAPAAMIRRRRLQEAAERLRSEPHSDLAAIAADLGYADHAHMTNDFRTVLDFTPSAYRRDAR